MRSTFSFKPLIAALVIVVGALAIVAQSNPPAPTGTASAGQPQNVSGEKPQRKPSTRRPPGPPARVTVVPNQTQFAPQVVTIVHRLTGVKLLRLLQRQSRETFTIENIDPLTLMTDAHASILAGWALEDGKTIAARLPQAFAEIEVTESADVVEGAQFVGGWIPQEADAAVAAEETVLVEDGAVNLMSAGGRVPIDRSKSEILMESAAGAWHETGHGVAGPAERGCFLRDAQFRITRGDYSRCV